MAIKERQTADALDKVMRKNPTWMTIMNDNASELTGYWIDWFNEDSFKKVL